MSSFAAVEEGQLDEVIDSMTAHFAAEDNRYHPKENPTGYLNMATAANKVLSREICSYLPPYFNSRFTNYSKFEGQEETREVVCKRVPKKMYSESQTVLASTISALMDYCAFFFKMVSFEGDALSVEQQLLLNGRIVSSHFSKLHVVIHSPNLKYETIQKPTLVVLEDYRDMVQTEDANVIYVYRMEFKKNVSCAVLHSRNEEVLESLRSQAFFNPLSQAAQAAIVFDQDFPDPSEGQRDIYDSVSKMLKNDNVEIPVGNIIIGSGASSIIYGLLRSVFVPGDEVCVDAPFYFGFSHDFHIAGVNLIPKHDDVEKCTPLTRAQRAFEDGARGYLVCNPHNPTGRIYNWDGLEALCEWAAQRPTFQLIFDEMYAHCMMDMDEEDEKEVNALKSGDAIVLRSQNNKYRTAAMYAIKYTNIHVVRGFAKDFGLCGLKIGIGVSCNVTVLHNFRTVWLDAKMPHPCALHIADKLLKETNYGLDVWRRTREILGHSTSLLLQELEKAGIPYMRPLAGVNIMISLRAYFKRRPTMSEYGAWLELFTKYRMVVTFGAAFHMPESGWCRLCYIDDDEIIIEAVERLRRFINGIPLAQRIGSAPPPSIIGNDNSSSIASSNAQK